MTLLIPIALLLLSALFAFVIKHKKPFVVSQFAQICLLLTFLFSVGSKYWIGHQTHWTLALFHFDSLHITLKLQLDSLTWVMLCLVTFISLVIHSFTARYLASDQNQYRFIGQLSLLTCSVALLVLSGNLLTAFIAWQFIGLTLYLLLNHYHFNVKANKAAKKKFMINRLGDICFLTAVLLTFKIYGTTDYAVLFHSTTHSNAMILCLIFIAIMTKSAQFPFHLWLIDTMEAPTPVSALMHAGVINSGGFLLARLSPWYSNHIVILSLIFLVGITTALLSQFFSKTQRGVKNQLAYSTMGQMGYMVMQCGLGCFASAVFHLIAHGFYKSSLFLNSGNTLSLNNLKNESNHHQPKRILLSSIIGIVLIVFGFYWLHLISPDVTINPLLWLFISITIFTMTNQAVRTARSKSIILISIAAIAIILVVYLSVLSQMILTLSNAVPDKSIFNLPTILGFVIIAIFSYALYSMRNSKKAYLASLFKLNIEERYRTHLLNPIRKLGDIWIQGYQHLSKSSKRVASFFITLGILALITLAYITDQQPNGILHNIAILGSIITITCAGIIANRISNLRHFIHSLIAITILFSMTAFIVGSKQAVVIGIFHLANMLLVFIACYLLLNASTLAQHKTKKLVLNRLPIQHFYLCVLLILFIGIPGTSSFVSEFYLLFELLKHNVVYCLLFAIFMMLLALVVLHILQTHFFNPSYRTQFKSAVTPTTHIVCITIIAINIFNGVHPTLLLNTINSLIG